MVQMTATLTSANEDDLISIDPIKRSCYFKYEKELKFHKVYSQRNCIYEKSIEYASRELQKDMEDPNLLCVPYYFPLPNDSYVMCSPNEADLMTSWMEKVPEEDILPCLPDCEDISYKYNMYVGKLRRCDDYNIGTTELCTHAVKRELSIQTSTLEY